ncbi:hypothetical protein KJ909_00210 [Patescibacteria group bacterium]|nr:hypothetical protein [Patescibacteria group bacterium]
MTTEFFNPGKKLEGLDPDGTHTKSKIVVIDESGLPQYEPAGPGVANLEATGHSVRVVPIYRRKHEDHNTGGAKD